MARPVPRINAARVQSARIAQQSNAAMVAAASASAATQAQIDTAISGDLIAASPELAARFASVEERLDTLEDTDV